MIRCLVVDDSRAFRLLLRGILDGAPGVEVVGEAADADEALAQTLALRPDAITMDVRMPGQDGLAAIAEIMRVAPTPIVVVSAAGEDAHVSFEALRLGAVEVLPKPHGGDLRRFEREAEAVRLAVRAVGGLRLATRHSRRPGGAPSAPRRVELVGVAASTGGPAALQRLLSALPRDYPLPVLLAQHLHPGFEASFVRWLGASTGWRVRLAADGERPEPGTVHVAPADRHLRVEGRRIALEDRPPERGCRPSGTVLFASLAAEYGAAAAGLVLTGMGEDGAAGLLRLRERGAPTFAQGPATSVVYGMPRAAMEGGAAGAVLELDELPAALAALAGVAPR